MFLFLLRLFADSAIISLSLGKCQWSWKFKNILNLCNSSHFTRKSNVSLTCFPDSLAESPMSQFENLIGFRKLPMQKSESLTNQQEGSTFILLTKTPVTCWNEKKYSIILMWDNNTRLHDDVNSEKKSLQSVQNELIVLSYLNTQNLFLLLWSWHIVDIKVSIKNDFQFLGELPLLQHSCIFDRAH